MTRWLAAFVRGIDWLNEWVGKIVKIFPVVLLLLLLYEVVARSFFNAPSQWGIELMMFIVAGYFLIGGGYALLRSTHVRMDVLYHRWSPRQKAIVDLLTFALAAIYMIVLIWTTGDHAIIAIARQQHSVTAWGPPIYPLKAAIPIGFSLLFLQRITSFIRDLFFVFRGRSLE